MKAIVQRSYGNPGILTLKEVQTPRPKGDEVLVRIKASSVNYGNMACMTGRPLPVRMFNGFYKPQEIPGGDFSGIVEEVGEGITLFKKGDEVFGDRSDSGMGCYAEMVCAKENVLCLKPQNKDYIQSAAVPVAGATAYQGLVSVGKIKAGQRVLINGATGGVGSFAVQIAKSYNTEVTAVGSTEKLDILKGLGADFVLDYRKESFIDSGKKYDLIFDIGAKQPVGKNIKALTENGTYVACGFSPSAMFFGPWINLFSKKRVEGAYLAKANPEILQILKEMIEEEKIQSSVGKTYPLENTAKALQDFIDGKVKGKAVITID